MEICNPEIIENQLEFEGFDEEGNMETSDNYIYNCHYCEAKDCEYWSKYNE